MIRAMNMGLDALAVVLLAVVMGLGLAALVVDDESPEVRDAARRVRLAVGVARE